MRIKHHIYPSSLL